MREHDRETSDGQRRNDKLTSAVGSRHASLVRRLLSYGNAGIRNDRARRIRDRSVDLRAIDLSHGNTQARQEQ